MSITGVAQFNGTPDYNVKMAAFYTDGDSYLDSMQYPEAYSPILVSNVVNLGTIGSDFSITIDTSSLTPTDGDNIYLIMWIDDNEDIYHHTSEDWSYVEAYYNCPVFQDSIICCFYFEDYYNPLMNTEYGWNQSIGLASFIPIDSSIKDGSKIQI